MKNKSRILRLTLPVVISCLLLFLVGATGKLSQAAPINSTEQPPSGVQTFVSNSQQLQFQLTLGTVHVDTQAQSVTVDGLDQSIQDAGAPALPYYATYIVLPPGATAVVKINAVETAVTQIGHLQPAPTPKILPDDVTTDAELAFAPTTNLASEMVIEPDIAIYNANKLYPAATYTLSEPMYSRDLRLVALKLFPLRYNPVTGELHQANQLEVTITFNGADFSNPKRIAAAFNNTDLDQAILNADKIEVWRHLPNNLQETAVVTLPLNTDNYKIAVNEDGLYDISYAALAAAGMDVTNVNPQTFAMMYQGQPVAFQFIGNEDTVFESGEKIRFYGQAFTGLRSEKQYITDNIYWLWANDPANRHPITSATNKAGQGYPQTATFLSTITTEPEVEFFNTWENNWETAPNEPDSWFWGRISQVKFGLPVTKTYDVELPYPVANGMDATYLVEVTARESKTAPTGARYVTKAYVNDYPAYAETTWFWFQHPNNNLVGSVPQSSLNHLTNTVKIVFTSDKLTSIYLNRVTVTYTRQLMATADQLIFNDHNGGQKEFKIAGFSEGDAQQVVAWDVSDPQRPLMIPLEASHISGSGSYTYTLGSDHDAAAQFIVTTEDNIQTPLTIDQYTPPDLTPPTGQAEWLAIAHADFMAPTNQLADHRASSQYGGLSTWVVDGQDIINQHGYGLPLPEAIRHYLREALINWDTPPTYVTLIGDATINPRNLACTACTGWSTEYANYVPTDLLYVDRFQGLIPSDPALAMLIGDDLLPDVALGRIAVRSSSEAQAVVDKIIQYDDNQVAPETWQQNILFVADNADNAGDFCAENAKMDDLLQADLTTTHLCLEDNTITKTVKLREDMSQAVNVAGTSILNYRGHGSIQYWAVPSILTATNPTFWNNGDRPLIILSADCLDGHFAWPGWPALSESFLRLPNGGSAAHWSSSGLGYTFEHTVLLTGFYSGLFTADQTAMGDASNYAKLYFSLSGAYEESEMYSFTLQGDPAMQIFQPDLEITKETAVATAQPGDIVTFTLQAQNNGLYATHPLITDVLPAGLAYVSSQTSSPMTTTVSNNMVTFAPQSPLYWGETVTIVVTTTVPEGQFGDQLNQAIISGMGLDLQPENNVDQVTVNVSPYAVDLLSFTLTAVANGIQIDWQTEFEIGITGYQLYRRDEQTGGDFALLTNIGDNGFITATGGTILADYAVLDEMAVNQTRYTYQLVALQNNNDLFVVTEKEIDTRRTIYLPLVIK